ncbi:MAG: SGNH/GDSL hydrolase family protein [Rhodococcus sp.]|nr:SGNH/GDSL hydrolase family protein [Rhodococcus sp. (in: high G+C Gram-positive bacteria)]MBJ7323341.1 SGNH/GDSL hydrolase family protein [Rhodococcus sp. (in: high G+C Gram-positive bacteria)]
MRFDLRVRHISLQKRTRLFAIYAGVLCVLILVGVSTYSLEKRNGSAAEYVSTYAPPKPLFPRVSDFGGLLKQNTQVVFSVLGDSTGNEVNEWVHLLANKIAFDFAKTVTIHDWSDETNSYLASSTIGDGGNGPVSIWNGSVAGADARYVTEHIAALLPEPSDLVLFNLGHNYISPGAAIQGQSNLLITIRKQWPENRSAIAITLQNPRLDSSEAKQASKVNALRSTFSGRADVSVIDVWSAFVCSPELSPLLRTDGFNPSDAGQKLWMSVASQALGVDGS